MTNKTCGECKHFYDYVARRAPCCWSKPTDNACLEFEQKVITNGDVIRQMSNEKLAELFDNSCKVCSRDTTECDVECVKGILAWLNAPADCVKQNSDHDTQTALCKADNTESEGEDEP